MSCQTCKKVCLTNIPVQYRLFCCQECLVKHQTHVASDYIKGIALLGGLIIVAIIPKIPRHRL